MFFLFALLVISNVLSEGYYCPYSELAYDGFNDLVYDYYDSYDGGNSWVRLGQTGWMTRTDYCSAKGDLSQHWDAGEAKCSDSQGTCYWDSGSSSCLVNTERVPDCLALCEAVLNGQGLQCMGGCPEGNVSRDTFYAICDGESEVPVPVESPTESSTESSAESSTSTTIPESSESSTPTATQTPRPKGVCRRP